jgi:hypothetical protein
VNGEYHSKLDQKGAQKLLKKIAGGDDTQGAEASE